VGNFCDHCHSASVQKCPPPLWDSRDQQNGAEHLRVTSNPVMASERATSWALPPDREHDAGDRPPLERSSLPKKQKPTAPASADPRLNQHVRRTSGGQPGSWRIFPTSTEGRRGSATAQAIGKIAGEKRPSRMATTETGTRTWRRNVPSHVCPPCALAALRPNTMYNAQQMAGGEDRQATPGALSAWLVPAGSARASPAPPGNPEKIRSAGATPHGHSPRAPVKFPAAHTRNAERNSLQRQ